MPRVTSHVKSPRETKRPYRCSRCKLQDSLIVPGQSYYKWAIKSSYGGTVYYQHVECGRPRPTQLSHSKTAQLDEAVEDANTALSEWTPTLDEDGEFSGDYGDVTSICEEVAQVARDIGQEYQDGFDNMPEGLQYGSTGQAMEDVAQRLETYADELESFSPSEDEPDLPERDEDPEAEDGLEDEVAWRERRETALSDWADGVTSDAESLLSDIPYYEG